MYGTYESMQSVEISVFKPAVEDDRELLFTIDMECTTSSDPGQYHGDNAYPPEAPEFELGSIHVHKADGNLVKVDYDVLFAILGAEAAQQMIDDATDDAIENGDF